MRSLDQELSRRGFLTGGLIVLLALAPTGLFRVLRRDEHDPTALARERLTGLLRDPAELEPLGRAYLAARSDRPGSRALIAELLPPDMTEGDVIEATDAHLRTALREWTTRDLAAGRFEQVEGWLLGRTEVRLAALVARTV